ncbi:MAG: hypothetical protein U0746_16295 [Gemmataceae bacterium]
MMRLSPSTVICIAASLAPHDVAHAQSKHVNIVELTDNIRSNEQLYHNYEVRWDRSYRFHTENVPLPAAVGGLVAITETGRCIRQGGLYFFREDTTNNLQGGQIQKFSMAQAYDGSKTRVLSAGVANVVDGQQASAHDFHSHSWIILRDNVKVPLSVLLRGGDELKKHPSAGVLKDAVPKVSAEAVEVIDGLNCVRVNCDVSFDGHPLKPYLTYRLWLAIDRNYLPVQTECYMALNSRILPTGVRRASDFKELAPGVWLFHRLDNRAYDNGNLRQGKAVVNQTEEFSITVAHLNPDYPVEEFSKVDFPERATVYDVNSSGKIVGEKRPAVVSRVQNNFAWLLIAAVAVAAALVVRQAVRRVRSRAVA